MDRKGGGGLGGARHGEGGEGGNGAVCSRISIMFPGFRLFGPQAL